MNFSIVIPVYNEEKRIPKSIDQIFGFFKEIPHQTEIIFVNDGSADKTPEVLKTFRDKYDFQIISYEVNRGKGYAVRQGALSAKGDWIVFFDIDLATPLSEFNRLLSTLNSNDEVIVGSRRLGASKIVKSESKVRTFLGQGFTKLSNLLVPKITDFTCGFKCFSKSAAAVIFPRARIDRWGFDTELLYIAHLNGLNIRQMPVNWAHDSDSRVNVVQAILSSLKELAQMKLNRLKGCYK